MLRKGLDIGDDAKVNSSYCGMKLNPAEFWNDNRSRMSLKRRIQQTKRTRRMMRKRMRRRKSFNFFPSLSSRLRSRDLSLE